MLDSPVARRLLTSPQRARLQRQMDAEIRRSAGHLAVLVVGTDAVIEALPARPIQLAHACSAAGYDLVVPQSWGDELVAETAIHALQSRSSASAVLCACPVVRQRLLHHGPELSPSLVSIASPPIAAARYLRSNLGDRLKSVDFVGRCPDARHGEYDAVWEPPELFAMLRDRGIDLRSQPDVFVDRLPPDRSRHYSLPGGCPSADALWHGCNERVLVELDTAESGVELAQHLLASGSALVDVATAMGCTCSGVTHVTPGPSARIAATSLEPPRSPKPVLGGAIRFDLEVPVHPQEADSRVPRPTRHKTPARAPLAVTPRRAIAIEDWPDW